MILGEKCWKQTHNNQPRYSSLGRGNILGNCKEMRDNLRQSDR